MHCMPGIVRFPSYPLYSLYMVHSAQFSSARSPHVEEEGGKPYNFRRLCFLTFLLRY